MKLGIFVYQIPIGKSGGVQQYAEQLIYALGKYSNIEIVVFCSPWNRELFEKYKRDNILIVDLGRKYKYIRAFVNNRYVRKYSFLSKLAKVIFSNKFSQKLMKLFGDSKFMIEEMVDLIHFPYQVLDRYDFNIPTLISLHDLQHKHFPEFFTKDEIEKRDTYFRKSAELCTRIIVSFEHIKKDIVDFYEISPEKIDICSLGYDLGPDINLREFSEIQGKYNISDEYLIYPALTWKHKNHIGLIQALKLLHNKFDKKIQLVCTGTRSDFYSKINSEIKKLNLEKQVLFTDFIPEKEFQILLKKAKLVVIPTLYEAESIPLLEAMAMGVPVICSNVTVLPEQIGDKRFIFNPYDIKEIAEKIHQMLNDEKLRKANIENSKKQISKIRWEKQITNFVSCYQKAYGSKRK